MTEYKAGRELDALIAEKAMGWKRLESNFENCDWFTDNEGVERFCRDTYQGYNCSQFCPSQLIADAWLVLDEFFCFNVGTDGMIYLCAVYTEPKKKYLASVATAPLAICLAALKTVED